jgi:hypothetical protein
MNNKTYPYHELQFCVFFIDRQSQFYKFEFLKISFGDNFGRTPIDWATDDDVPYMKLIPVEL